MMFHMPFYYFVSHLIRHYRVLLGHAAAAAARMDSPRPLRSRHY